ncbi:TPA: hypothetical protein DCZ36_03610 [Candidatus Gracilibacteria bacterium]|nr:hypothetical protein [Candidatus Gracilibacteria bacterium]
MKLPRNVFENPKIIDFLEKRNLLKQYKKSKKKLLSSEVGGLDFKEREPKKSGIYSFRINKQFRVFGFFDEQNDFIISEINNHQN